MKTKDRFEEIKIKMVMKLKKISHSAAVAEIAASDARRVVPQINREGDEDDLMSAKEFFGED